MPIPPENTPLGVSISEIIDRTTKIVHEEIELAKAEMSVAAQDLLRGSVAGIVGGVFAFFGLFILLIALSFLVADAIGTWYPWLGFFIVAFTCFALGGLLAFVALKKIKKGSQIVPNQAIAEAKQTKEALKAEADKPLETIDSVAVEEPASGAAAASLATPVKPAGKSAEKSAASPAVAEAKEDLKEAREEANELELDAKELKKRAKQEAKEAKEAAKAAKLAEQEVAKAEAVAAKAAEKAEKEAAKAAKAAEKKAKKGGGEAPAQAPPAGQAKPYVPPTPPADSPAAPQPPQQPPAPPSQSPPAPQPPAPPSDTSKPNDPKRDN